MPPPLRCRRYAALLSMPPLLITFSHATPAIDIESHYDYNVLRQPDTAMLVRV